MPPANTANLFNHTLTCTALTTLVARPSASCNLHAGPAIRWVQPELVWAVPNAQQALACDQSLTGSQMIFGQRSRYYLLCGIWRLPAIAGPTPSVLRPDMAPMIVAHDPSRTTGPQWHLSQHMPLLQEWESSRLLLHGHRRAITCGCMRCPCHELR